MLVVALSDDTHHFAQALNFFNKCDFAAKVHDATNRNRRQEKHLVDSSELC